MKSMNVVLSVGILIAGGAAVSTAASGPAGGSPTYTNAEVVSIDAAKRTLVIKKGDGAEQTAELGDNVAGLADIKAGDYVILTLRGEPGRPRVSAIAKSTVASRRVEPAPRPTPPTTRDAPDVAREAFARQVASLAQEANRVDRLWSEFRKACNATVSTRYEGAREWFGLWGNDVHADLSNGFCRDLFDQVVGSGETVKRGMAGAEEAARRSLSPGSIRDVRLRYSMDWDGWDRPAPDRLQPY
jgi:hypothetical protein